MSTASKGPTLPSSKVTEPQPGAACRSCPAAKSWGAPGGQASSLVSTRIIVTTNSSRTRSSRTSCSDTSRSRARTAASELFNRFHYRPRFIARHERPAWGSDRRCSPFMAKFHARSVLRSRRTRILREAGGEIPRPTHLDHEKLYKRGQRGFGAAGVEIQGLEPWTRWSRAPGHCKARRNYNGISIR
jgi:hypothetical protein